MKKITLLLVLVCSMSMFATRYLVQTGAPGAATWRAAGAGEVLVDLTVNGQSLNAWLSATFPTSFLSGDEIWLVAGTYNIVAVYNIPANFAMYGGFAGTETTTSERVQGTNPWDFVNETIIDGGNTVTIFGCASNRTALYDGLTLTKGYISGNSGAMMLRLGVVVRNSKFINNVATGQGGAILMNGGGEIKNSYFSGNTAPMGGAVHVGGTGASLISGCLFENNKSISGSNMQGGAIRSQSSNAIIQNSTFINNEAAGNGSAIYTQVDVAVANKIINSIFYGNKTKSALYLRGAAVYNSTVVNNDAGGVYIATKDAQIYNSVFWADAKAKATVSGVNVSGIEFKNNAAITIPGSDQWIISDNLQLDTLISETNYPYFADPENNDWQITYQSPLLNTGSSAISGVPAVDFLSVSRPQGASYDIGAYELPYFNTTVTFNAGGTVNALTSGDVLSEPKGKPLAFTITPSGGQQVASVKYNNVEVKEELVDGVYTAPALAANATLVVEFSATTSVNEINSGFVCFANGNSIEIRGMKAGEEINVYSITGAALFTQKAVNNSMSVPVARGIYIVKAANQVKKVVVD